LTVKFMSNPGWPFGQPFGVARAIPGKHVGPRQYRICIVILAKFLCSLCYLL
jgi:hypothetical protein